MTNPFSGRNPALAGPFVDIVPVTPDDSADLTNIGLGLYVETGGTIVFDTVSGQRRTVDLADFSNLPVGVRRVLATGTTAIGIHAFVF